MVGGVCKEEKGPRGKRQENIKGGTKGEGRGRFQNTRKNETTRRSRRKKEDSSGAFKML